MINGKNSFFTTVLKESSLIIKDQILLLDDCRVQQYFLSKEFEGKGINVKCVSSIDEALRYIESSNNINLIISDIGLSDGESGLDFVKILKNSYEFADSIPIIAVSSDDCKENALAAGFDAFIKKPVSTQDCINILYEFNIEKNQASEMHLRIQ